MKKRVIGCFLAAVLAASMAGCGGQGKESTSQGNENTSNSSDSSTDSASGKVEGGKLIVGFDSAFPPMGFVGDDGGYTGFDLELAAEVADRLGMEIEYRPIDWNSKDLEQIGRAHV